MVNPYFNAQYYLTQNPDLIAAGINTVDAAWAHYVNYGAAEALNGVSSRSPAPWFDVQYYLSANPDLVTSGLTGAQLFEHFVKYGINEGRVPSATAANMTDASLLAYAKGNADLATAFGVAADATSLTDAQRDGLANHFYEYGYKEGRADAPFTPDSNPGQTFTLTTGIDNFTGTAGNDTFIAGAVGATSTLNPGDQIDGGAGTDTLKLYDASNAAAFGSAVIKNVEIVENYATSDLNVSANAGVQQVWQMGNAGAATATTASLAQTVGLSGAFSDDATVTFNNANGANDSATIAVKDAAVAATKSVFVANIENLTVQAAGKNALTTLSAADAKSLTITGEGSVSAAVTTTGATLAKIDASGNTGGVTLSVANTAVAAAGIAITGGTGNDSISLTGTAVKSTVDLGAGNDTLSISAVPTAGSTLNGGEGTDTLVLNGVTMTAAAGKMFTNFEHLKLGTGTSVYAVGDIAGIASYEIGAGTSATLNKLASGADVLISGDNAVTLNIATPVAANASIDVSLNNAAKAAANGVVVNTLTTTAHTVNIESAGLVNTTHNKVVLADTAAVTDVHITGSQAFDFSVAGNTNNTVAIINGSAATGALALDASNAKGGADGVFVTGGSANDVITAAAGVANTIKGGLGADLIKLGTGADKVVLTSQADSTATAFDAVTGFTAGTDKIDISAFNIKSSLQKVGVSDKATVDINTTAGSEITSTFTITDADAAGFFTTTGGVQNGVMIVVDSAAAAEGAFAFIDVDGDGNWNAATDAVIALVGADYSTITDTSFVFA